MILQRLATSIRKQDWFTVLIETLIVVFGVFIGLQVNNWNQRQQALEREQVILERLHADFETLEVVETYALTTVQNSFMAADQLVDIVEADRVNTYPSQYLLPFVQAVISSSSATLGSPTYEEIVSSGQVSLIRDAELRVELANFSMMLKDYQSVDASFDSLANELVLPIYKLASFDDKIGEDGEPELGNVVDFDFEALNSDPQLLRSLYAARRIQITRYGRLSRLSIQARKINEMLEKMLDEPASERVESIRQQRSDYREALVAKLAANASAAETEDSANDDTNPENAPAETQP